MCPSHNKSYIGNEKGPTFNLNCLATQNFGHWIKSKSNCKCLSATKPEDLIGTNCGWCPFHKIGYLGDENGPYFNLTCPSNVKDGQWTWSKKNYKCLTISKCEDIEGTDCGWCPSLNKAFIGNEKGPIFDLKCNPRQLEGHWIKDKSNCKCLSATKPEDLVGTKCGWCPSLKKAYLGDENGPFFNLSCQSTMKDGQWTWNKNDYKCLIATKCQDIKGTNCGWCESSNKAYIGNEKGPIFGLECKFGWTNNYKDCGQLTFLS